MPRKRARSSRELSLSPDNRDRRLSQDDSTDLLRLWASCDGDWSLITKTDEWKVLNITKLKAQAHVKYIRSKKNKKITKAGLPGERMSQEHVLTPIYR